MSNGKQITPKDVVNQLLESVEIRVDDLINANQSLQELAHNEYPVLLSYKISKTLNAVEKITTNFSKKRKEVLERLGKWDDTKKQYIFEGDNEKIATKEVADMLEQKTVAIICPLSIDDFAGMQMKPGTLALLDWLIS